MIARTLSLSHTDPLSDRPSFLILTRAGQEPAKIAQLRKQLTTALHQYFRTGGVSDRVRRAIYVLVPVFGDVIICLTGKLRCS